MGDGPICFLCLQRLLDGRDIITVGLGFDGHRECYEREDE